MAWGQHHVAHRISVRQAKRLRCRALTLVNTLYAGPKHLGDIGRVGQDQGHGSPDVRRIPRARKTQPRDAEPDQVDDQDHGHAAEDVCVKHSKQANGIERRRPCVARQSDQQPERKNQWRRPQENRDVPKEGVKQAGKGLGKNLGVEEAFLDGRPTGRKRHQNHDGQEHSQA